MTPSVKMSDKGKKVRDYERLNEKNWETWMDGWMERNETDWRLRPLSATVCQSVSVTMTGLQQWGTLNSSVHTAAHRGFTRWQTEPRAVLSTAYHSLQWSPTVWLPVEQPTLLFSSPICTQKTFWCSISGDLMACTVSEKSENESWDACTRFEKSEAELFKSNFIFFPDCRAGHQRIPYVCNRLIPHFWNMNVPDVRSEINARKRNKLSCNSLFVVQYQYHSERRGSYTFTPAFPLEICKAPSYAFNLRRVLFIFEACQWYRHCVTILLGTSVQSNTIQYNSSAANSLLSL